MIESSMEMSAARNLLSPLFMSTVKDPKFTSTPEAPTIANRMNVLLYSKRSHHACMMNSRMSEKPSFVVPLTLSTNSTGIS